MTKHERTGRIDIKKSAERPLIRLWGIVGAEEIIAKLEELHTDSKEKDAILKGWEDIVGFTQVGGVLTSGGIIIPRGTPESIQHTKGAKLYGIGTDFVPSLGYVPTTGGSVNLYSQSYTNLLGIRKGLGKYMHTIYNSEGVIDHYTVDPNAIAQQVLLNLAVTRGQGRIESV